MSPEYQEKARLIRQIPLKNQLKEWDKLWTDEIIKSGQAMLDAISGKNTKQSNIVTNSKPNNAKQTFTNRSTGMIDIIDEMGGYMGDGSEFELPPQVKGKLEYHSTPITTDNDELRTAIVNAAAGDTKHISTYEKGMKNLIIDIDMLVEQMEALFQSHHNKLLGVAASSKSETAQAIEEYATQRAVEAQYGEHLALDRYFRMATHPEIEIEEWHNERMAELNQLRNQDKGSSDAADKD